MRSSTTKIFQLPVANTLFQNGLESTLYAQQWVMTEKQPLPAGRSRLPYQVLNLLEISNPYSGKAPFRIGTRLQQITSPRVIAASLGNIIRRLSSDEIGEDSVPASTELEASVPKWLASRESTMEQVQVWALVIPQRLWSNQDLSGPVDLQRELEQGSRLHKVLSGGGGWGVKKGLLALDPDLEYYKAPDAGLETFDVGNNSEAHEEPQKFGEVVRPGDVVAFYAYDEPTLSKTRSAASAMKRSWHIHGAMSIGLGAVPSTMDRMPGAVGRVDMTDVDYIFAENHFGMVSEQGMAMTSSTAGHDAESMSGVEAVIGTVQTKLDVPYTRVSFGSDGHSIVSEIPNAASI